LLTSASDREEALKDDYPLDGSAYDDEEDEEWAGDDTTWNDEAEPDEENDAKDESTAYLEFLNEEAQKFQNLEADDSDDELGEESLLETPLDKVEPYQLFRDGLLSMLSISNPYLYTNIISELQHQQPQLYESLITNLSPEEQAIVQGVVHQAEANAQQAAAAAAALAAGQVNGAS
jgi:hypothetical protein